MASSERSVASLVLLVTALTWPATSFASSSVRPRVSSSSFCPSWLAASSLRRASKIVSPEPSFSQASPALRRPSVGCSVSTISSFSSTLADIALKFFSSAATLSAFGATAARSSRLDARLTKPTRSAKPCDTGTWVETSLSSVIMVWLASPPSVMETMVMSAWAFSPAGSSTSLSLVWVFWAAFTISSPRALSLRRSSTAPSSAPSLLFIAAISFFSRSIASRSDWVRATSSSRFAMPS